MGEYFMGEIKISPVGYAPKGWALCNGQSLPIAQNQALYALLGTTFGGDGNQTFALPDFRQRVPIHVGNNHNLGTSGGEASHALSIPEIPAHTHTLYGTGAATTTFVPGGNLLGQTDSGDPIYAAPTDTGSMGEYSSSTAGAGQGHQNMQPYLTLNFSIALTGVFPSRS